MKLMVNIMYESHIDVLISKYKYFEGFKDMILMPKDRNIWNRKQGATYDAQVIFVGKTGYGKSTTINAIVGAGIMESRCNEPCTRVCQSAEYRLHPNKNYYLSFGDLPGIGESIEADRIYLELYSNFLKKTDLPVYILRADTRDWAVDEKAFNILFNDGFSKKRVLVGLNYSDKIQPINRQYPFIPSYEQIDNIKEKIKEISKLFGISERMIIPYSASEKWNIRELVKAISENLMAAVKIAA